MANRNFNRTSQTPQTFIFVGAGNQTLASGALVSGTSALNIASQQLGVLSTDNTGATLANNFITAGHTSQQVKRIKVLQGTPGSANLNSVSAFGIGTKAYLQTPEIDPANIVSVATTLPEISAFSAIHLGAFSAPLTATDYSLTFTLESVTTDIEYAPQRRSSIEVSVTSPAVAPAFPTSYVLQTLASKANKRSIYNPQVGSGKSFVVFGINTTAGTLISGIAAGTVIPFQTLGGQTVNFTATIPFVKMLQNAIAAGVLAGTEYIVNIDAVAAGTTSAVEELLIVGLQEQTALLFDEETRNVVHVHSAGCNLKNTTKRASEGKDWVGTGKMWQFQWKKRGGQPYFENWYASDLFGSVTTTPSYIVNSDSQLYTSTIITFNTVEGHTSEFTQTIPHKLVILLPASITNPTANAATPYVVATSDSATVTALNASLGAWLNHAYQQWTNHKYYQAATPAAPFV
jgi:hypothetical protein